MAANYGNFSVISSLFSWLYHCKAITLQSITIFKGNVMKIAVYCSSRPDLAQEYVQVAAEAGKWIGTEGHELVYGGVNAGLMHTVAQAAHDAGAKITGVIPEVFKHRADELNDEIITTQNLNDRKAKMIELSDAFIVLPGGLGTIDEWIATLSALVVAGDTERKIIVANINGIYDHTVAQIASTAHSPFARSEIIDMSIIAHDGSELIDILNRLQH